MQYLLCLFLPALAAASEVDATHPIKNVMTMIQNLDQKAVALGKEEAVSFEKYEAFMEKEKKSFSKAIAGFKGDVEETDSTLKALKAKKEASEGKKEASENRLAKLTAATADAKSEYNEADALFRAKLADINATMQALSGGLASLEAVKQKPAADGKQDGLLLLRTASSVAKSLVNEHASLLEVASKEDETTLLELAAVTEDLAEDIAAPTKAPVKSHTGSVVDLLKKLLLSYEDQHKQTTLEAMKAKGEFDLAQASQSNSISLVETSKKKHESSLAEVTADISTAKSELAAAERDLETNSKSLKDTETELKIKTDEFKERAYMRNKEREAFKFGLQVLAKVSGLQAPVSLLQLPASPKMQVLGKQLRAINLLHEAAHLAKSQQLHRLASELEDGGAPIAEVAKNVDLTIAQQIFKINADTLDDDKKRFWCEQEVNKTNIEKKFKGEELQELKDKIDVTEANIAELGEALELASKKLTDSKKDMHEEVMLREKDKNENAITVKDAQESQEAVKVAMKTIKKYYDEASSFIQVDVRVSKSHKGAPSPGWSKAGYAGSDGQSTLLDLLETTVTEYATMEATVNAEEADQAAQHENKMKDWKAIVAETETEKDLKSQEKLRLVEKLQGFTESAKLTDRQAASLANYLEDVTSDCYGGNSTFKTRAAERAAEVASLNASRGTLADAFNTTQPSNGTQLLRSWNAKGTRAKHLPGAAFLAPNP